MSERALRARTGRPQACLDLSLGHLRTTQGDGQLLTPSSSLPFLPKDRIRWRVFLWIDGAWETGPTLPEGAAASYAARQRVAKAIAFEAVATPV